MVPFILDNFNILTLFCVGNILYSFIHFKRCYFVDSESSFEKDFPFRFDKQLKTRKSSVIISFLFFIL